MQVPSQTANTVWPPMVSKTWLSDFANSKQVVALAQSKQNPGQTLHSFDIK
jgi:hypothetical protein